MDAETTSDELVRAVGELAISVWHLGYLVEEIGLQLGHDVGNHSAANARAAIRRHLAHEPLPPWTREAEPAQITEWLDEVEDCVGAYQDVVRAFATTATGAPSRRLPDGSRHPVTLEDLKALLTASQTLSRTGDALVDRLALTLSSGERLYGYDHIVRNLYATHAEPEPVAGQPLA